MRRRHARSWDGSRRYDLAALITDMMQGDVKLVKKEVYLKKGGFYTPNYFE